MNWIHRFFDFFSFNFAPSETVALERSEKHEVMKLLPGYFDSKGGIGEAIKIFERAGFAGKVRSWASDGASLPINSVEALQLIGWKDLREMSTKADVPVERLRELLAETLPIAVRKALS